MAAAKHCLLPTLILGASAIVGFRVTNCHASTVVPDHLSGLRGVNVHAQVIGDDPGANCASLSASILEKSENGFREGDLRPVAENGETFVVEIHGQRIPVGVAAGELPFYSVLAEATLREEVRLVRDGETRVPGGGAVTWRNTIVQVVRE